MAGRIKSVKIARELTAEDKLAPQAKGIIESVTESHGIGTAVSVEDVVKAMDGNITTRQPLERIFGYYAPKLEELGLIEVERSAAEPKSKKDKTEAGEDISGELSDEGEELGDDDLGEDDDDLGEDADLDEDGDE